ncbi:MAG: hypothetical protein AB1416_04055 [Actinomycetota bacterium]
MTSKIQGGRRRTLMATAAALILGTAAAFAIGGLANAGGPPERVTPGADLGLARDGHPIGVDQTGAVHLPELTAGTRPVIVGRRIEIAPAVRRRVDVLNAAFSRCMAANGAQERKLDIGGSEPLIGWADPGLAAQKKCREPLGESEAFAETRELRVAALAAAALRIGLSRCLEGRGAGDLDSAAEGDFVACSAVASSAIER